MRHLGGTAPPPRAAAAATAPRPRCGPARNEKTIYPSLSLCCFLAYITINARPVSVCRGRGRAAARGGRAGAQAAGGRQHRHQGPTRPRRLSAPPRYWRRRSRAISLRRHHAHSQPRQPRQLHGGSGERGEGGQEDASGSAPRRATASSAFSSSCSSASSPPPPVAAAAWSFAAASCRRRRRRWCRRCRSTNYIRATRTPRPSENLGSFRRAPPLPPSAFLPAPRGSGTPPSANLGSARPSSSSEAWLASSRPVSSFRSSNSPKPFGERALIASEVLHVNKGTGGATRSCDELDFIDRGGHKEKGKRGNKPEERRSHQTPVSKKEPTDLVSHKLTLLLGLMKRREGEREHTKAGELQVEGAGSLPNKEHDVGSQSQDSGVMIGAKDRCLTRN
ncbi:serine/arginine repetitive matrix protein 3-like [Mustela lutreola]|uniref:serine/arginine repetitive matrix protein 3-like n=1 Tax=Mustela lutreola TaxID=9666 RepID=UPI00279708A0|nr:serine/arginine repetitive matrix protein 3-like [Mustela lutreola]